VSTTVEALEPATILVVDDEPTNITILAQLLAPEYHVLVANSGARALELVESSTRPDIVLLDVMMPGLSGFDVCARLKTNPLTADVPVIFVTAMSDERSEEKGFHLGAVDYITKPVVPAIVMARVKAQLALHSQTRALEQLVSERTLELNDTRLKVIQRLGRAAEYRDNETGMHVIRMAKYSRMLAEQVGMSPRWTALLYDAAPMHDVGKIGIPDSILLKPGKLDPDEWEIMKSHTTIGAQIIGDPEGSDLLALAASMALHHHEKWDGTGYPHGLSGDEIPIEARIIAVADVFDALCSDRPYKTAWTTADAMTWIGDQTGAHFDPQLAQAFVTMSDGTSAVQAQHAD